MKLFLLFHSSLIQFTIVAVSDCSTLAKRTSLYILSKRDPFSLFAFNAALLFSKVFEEMQVNPIRLFKWCDPNSRCNTRDAF